MEKKTRFYLIRHGETDWNKGGKYQGWTDIELNDAGREQARLLGLRFRHMPLDAVYVSPLKRAIATAEPLARTKGLTPIVDEHFKEINFGEWEGFTIAQLSEKYGKAYTDFFDDPFSYPMPGEGSFQNVIRRTVPGFEALEQKHKGQNTVALLGMDIHFYRKTWMTNTSITMLDIAEDGRRLLMTLNDKAHLELAELLGTGE